MVGARYDGPRRHPEAGQSMSIESRQVLLIFHPVYIRVQLPWCSRTCIRFVSRRRLGSGNVLRTYMSTTDDSEVTVIKSSSFCESKWSSAAS